MVFKLSPETQEHILAMDWLRLRHPELARQAIHIANERKTTWSNGNILKRMGVRPGVPDLFWPIPVGCYHGLFIEIKSENGRPSPYQKEFIMEAVANGYYASFAYGAQEVIDILCSYFSLPHEEIG